MISMDDNERASVREFLTLARLSIMAMLVVGGYLNRDILLGVI